MSANTPADPLKEMRGKLKLVKGEENIVKFLNKSLDVLDALTKKETNSEKVITAKTSLEKNRKLVQLFGNKRNTAIHKGFIVMSEHLEQTAEWMVKKNTILLPGKTVKIELQDQNDEEVDESDKLTDQSTKGPEMNIIPSKRGQTGQWKCEVCGVRLKTKSSWTKHKKSHDAKRVKFDCDVCGMSFTMTSNLNRHKQVHATTRELFECETCGNKYTSKAALKDHQRCHLDDELAKKPYQCDQCDRRFPNSTGLRAHKKSHLDVTDPTQATRKRPFKCEECGKSFQQRAQLESHMKWHSEEVRAQNPHGCDTCGMRFKHSALLQQHKIDHLVNKEDPRKRQCAICGKQFHTRKIVGTHIKLVHMIPRGQKNLKCEQCGKKFRCSQTLRHHMQNIHSGNRDKVECDVCGMAVYENNMKRHQLTHLVDNNPKLKPKCDVCGMEFRAPENLKQHMNFHTGDFPFKCHLCPKGFLDDARLQRHLKSHERGTVRKNRAKCCHLCPRRFKQKYELAIHLKRHEDGTVGDSNDSDEDEEEIIIHQCTICLKKWAHKRTCKDHITKHHPEALPQESYIRSTTEGKPARTKKSGNCKELAEKDDETKGNSDYLSSSDDEEWEEEEETSAEESDDNDEDDENEDMKPSTSK